MKQKHCWIYFPLGESDCLVWSNDKDDMGYTWISIKSLQHDLKPQT